MPHPAVNDSSSFAVNTTKLRIRNFKHSIIVETVVNFDMIEIYVSLRVTYSIFYVILVL